MKKIVVAFNDFSLPVRVMDCAIEMAALHGATLVGLFMNSVEPVSGETYPWPNDINLTDKDFTKKTDTQEKLRLEQSITTLFKNACVDADIPFHIQEVHKNHLDVLSDQSEFTDMVLMDARSESSQYSLKTFLTNTRCPVVLVPYSYEKPASIIFTYDDTSPDMYAIKAFTYLFTALKHLPVSLVSVVAPNILGLQYREQIESWLMPHYPNATVDILKGTVKDELTAYINQQKSPLVVMGAYGRSNLSLLFKESLANMIVQNTRAILFMAHD
jgi:nucleotide-binding universal stress UspA family protein